MLEQSSLRHGLQHIFLAGVTLTTQRLRNPGLALRLGFATESLVCIRQCGMRVDILRLKTQGAFQKACRQCGVVLLERDLSQQEVGADRRVIQPDGLLQNRFRLLVVAQPNVPVPEPPLSEPHGGIDREFLLKFGDGSLRVRAVEVDLAQQEVGHRKAWVESQRRFHLW